MYICDKCGELTEELPSYKEARPWGSTVAYEEIVECDCGCGGTFMNAKQCEHCGNIVAETNIQDGMCPKCSDRLDEKLRIFLDEFSDPEYEYILNRIYTDYC